MFSFPWPEFKAQSEWYMHMYIYVEIWNYRILIKIAVYVYTPDGILPAQGQNLM